VFYHHGFRIIGGVFRGAPAKIEEMKIEIDFNAKTITPLTKVTAKDLADLVDKLPGDSSEWAIMPKPEAPQIVFMDNRRRLLVYSNGVLSRRRMITITLMLILLYVAWLRAKE
jgi:hypothetical protein